MTITKLENGKYALTFTNLGDDKLNLILDQLELVELQLAIEEVLGNNSLKLK